MSSPLSESLGKQEYKPIQSGFGPAFTPWAEKCTTSDELDIGCAESGPKHLNYETLAHNLLYAEMEIQRIAYEAGAMNESMATPDMFTTIVVVGTIQKYPVTYVPALLLGASVSILLVDIMTVSLTLYTSNTISGRVLCQPQSSAAYGLCLGNSGHSATDRCEVMVGR